MYSLTFRKRSVYICAICTGIPWKKGRNIILQVKHHIFIWKCENQNLQSVVDLPTSGCKKCFFFFKILAWKTYCTWNCEKKGMTLCTDTVCKGKYWNNINISEHLNIRWWSGVTVYIQYHWSATLYLFHSIIDYSFVLLTVCNSFFKKT